MTYDEVDVEEASTLAAGGVPVLDVRDQHEREAYRVAGSLHIPLPELADRLAEVPEGRLLVVCAKGMRSALAAELLEGAGRAEVSSVAGGTDGWMAAGKPIER